jgi:serine/threonine protein kinase
MSLDGLLDNIACQSHHSFIHIKCLIVSLTLVLAHSHAQGKNTKTFADPIRCAIKWTAMESMMENIFSEASDVWSIGIVYWEILTGGAMPYVKFIAPKWMILYDFALFTGVFTVTLMQTRFFLHSFSILLLSVTPSPPPPHPPSLSHSLFVYMHFLKVSWREQRGHALLSHRW